MSNTQTKYFAVLRGESRKPFWDHEILAEFDTLEATEPFLQSLEDRRATYVLDRSGVSMRSYVYDPVYKEFYIKL